MSRLGEQGGGVGGNAGGGVMKNQERHTFNEICKLYR